MLKLEPLLKHLKVVDKFGNLVPFFENQDYIWSQRTICEEVERQYNSGQPVRIIVLKARQLGISTVTAGIIFCWAFIHKNNAGLVVAHENRTSQAIFEKTKRFWEYGPYSHIYDALHATQRHFEWSNGSSIHIATAKNLGAGRGQTVQALHTSECSSYIDPDTLMLGLRQTLPRSPRTIEIVESTARGVGDWFHHQWQLAEEHESSYAPIFLPWIKHPEYRRHTSISTRLELDDEEGRLHFLGASFEHIEWRRYSLVDECNNDEEYFRQEYPATPDEAFITTGANIFDLRALQECYFPITGHKGRLMTVDPDGNDPVWTPDHNGPLTVFKGPPRKSHREDRFMIGGDPSRSTSGDPACIQVFDRQNMEQVAVWHGYQDPINFAKEMMMLGRYYHNAMLCPEVEGGGQATIAVILRSGYPNVWKHRWADRAQGKLANIYGFATNWNRKNWAVSSVQYLLGQRSVTLHDIVTFHQMQRYIRTSPWEYGPADNKEHDDAVMAAAITIFASMADEPFDTEEFVPAPVVDIYAGQGR